VHGWSYSKCSVREFGRYIPALPKESDKEIRHSEKVGRKCMKNTRQKERI
jgi:hypothetical protein